MTFLTSGIIVNDALLVASIYCVQYTTKYLKVMRCFNLVADAQSSKLSHAMVF